MSDKIERSIEELYHDDPERADALVFGRETGPNRRGFLGGAGLAAMGAAVGGAIPFAANMPGGLIPAAMAQGAARRRHRPRRAGQEGPDLSQFPGKNDKLVVIGERPLVAETPESLLDDDTTPIDKFFIRNNGQIPEAAKEPDKWKFTVDGEVNKKLELTLGELKSKFKPQTRRMVLECGGNGRSFFSPPASGNQWTNGGAGCAEWTGVRARRCAEDGRREAVRHLHRALRRRPASVRRRQQADAVARRADREGDGPRFHDRVGDERSAAAEHPWRTGAAAVPGLAGSASQKWLTRIVIRDKEHDGPGMTGTSYRADHQADGARRQGRSEELQDSRIDAGALDHHQSGATAPSWRPARAS